MDTDTTKDTKRTRPLQEFRCVVIDPCCTDLAAFIKPTTIEELGEIFRAPRALMRERCVSIQLSGTIN